jgi:hypothetical protein
MYISGKITGNPDYKQQFSEAAAIVEKSGYTPLNPANLPQDAFEWQGYMNIGLAILRECDAVCLLPNWPESEGARIEAAEAVNSGKAIIEIKEIREELARKNEARND